MDSIDANDAVRIAREFYGRIDTAAVATLVGPEAARRALVRLCLSVDRSRDRPADTDPSRWSELDSLTTHMSWHEWWAMVLLTIESSYASAIEVLEDSEVEVFIDKHSTIKTTIHYPPGAPRPARPVRYDDSRAVRVIKLARSGNPVARDVLVCFGNEFASQKAPQPPNLGSFFLEIAQHGRPPDRYSSVHSKRFRAMMARLFDGDTAVRNYKIAMTLRKVVELGFTRSENRGKRSGPPSAIAIVASAITPVVSKSTIEKAWEEHGARLPFSGVNFIDTVVAIQGEQIWPPRAPDRQIQ